MAILIDASVLIAYERGTLDAERRIAGREDEPFLLSVITASELLHAVHRAGDPARRARADLPPRRTAGAGVAASAGGVRAGSGGGA